MSKPFISSSVPKLSRCVPVSGSVPTGEPHAEHAQHHARHDGAAGEADERRHGEQHQPEILRRSEAQRQIGDYRPQYSDGERPEHAGEVGADGGDGERLTRAPLFRHGKSILGGDDGSDLARDVHQDRGGGAAVHGAVVDAGHDDDGAVSRQVERHRQEDRHGRGGAEARQDADERAKQAADQRKADVGQRQRVGETGDETGVHERSPVAARPAALAREGPWPTEVLQPSKRTRRAFCAFPPLLTRASATALCA
jgi:hypothetical protein